MIVYTVTARCALPPGGDTLVAADRVKSVVRVQYVSDPARVTGSTGYRAVMG